MADKDYNFTVFASDLKPFGAVGKENMDVIRLIYDFSCYLESDETVQAIEFPTIVVAPPGADRTSWRQDYPIDCCDPATVADDLYTLRVVSEAITTNGKSIEIRINAGTPNFIYVLSFVVVASTTRRRKQIDTLIRIEQPLNMLMVGPGDLDPDTSAPIIISSSTALPVGFDGLVVLENSGNTSGIVITFPPNPVLGQMLEFIDALGKDQAYPVTFRGDGDVPIDGDGRTVFVSSINYDCLRWKWMGSNWHLMALRFDFLA
jgi:hypothetical protein